MIELEIPQLYNKSLWPPNRYDEILCTMGRIIFNWNSIENCTRNLLNTLVKAGAKSTIVTAHMGTQDQINALKTIANTYLDRDQKEHILHAIKLYERLRGYRNYFVHGFSALQMGSSPMAGMVDIKAKGQFVIEELPLTSDNLAKLSHIIRCAVHYYNLIYCHFRYIDNKRQEYDRYRTLPEIKFPIPDKLQKSKRDHPILKA